MPCCLSGRVFLTMALPPRAVPVPATSSRRGLVASREAKRRYRAYHDRHLVPVLVPAASAPAYVCSLRSESMPPSCSRSAADSVECLLPRLAVRVCASPPQPGIGHPRRAMRWSSQLQNLFPGPPAPHVPHVYCTLMPSLCVNGFLSPAGTVLL